MGVREHLKCVWELKNWERRFRREYPSIPEMKGTFTAIILNYARPQNLDLLTRVLLNTPSVRRVVISNNDPVWNVHDWLHVSSDRVRVIEQSAKKSSATRALITRDESDTEHFLWMDDDIFLTPTQIEILCLELLSDPSAPHGICGQEWRDDGLGGYTNSKEGCIDVFEPRLRMHKGTRFGIFPSRKDPRFVSRKTGMEVNKLGRYSSQFFGNRPPSRAQCRFLRRLPVTGQTRYCCMAK